MFRQALLLIIFSAIAVFFIKEFTVVLHYLYRFYQWLLGYIAPIISNGTLGHLIRGVILLTVIPLIVAGIPAGLYWVINRKPLPIMSHLVWITWILLVAMLSLHH